MTTELEFYEVADIFPMKEPFEELKADIQRNGLLEPIRLYRGKIIDGRNRYKACMELGITPNTQEWLGEGYKALIGYVTSRNLHRRHLTSSQRAMAAADAKALLAVAKETRERQLSGLKKGNAPVPQKIGEREQKNVPVSQKIDQREGKTPPQRIGEVFSEDKTTTQNKHKNEAASIVAEMFDTNRQYVSDAEKIKETAPEKREEIRSGKKTIPQVMKEIKKERSPGPRGKTQKETWEDVANRFYSFVHYMKDKVKFPPDISREAKATYCDART